MYYNDCNNNKVFSKMSRIYIGDPFFALNGLAISAWKENFNFENGIFNFNGFNFAICNSEFEKGFFKDSDDNIYHIENHRLALIPMELVDQEKNYEDYGIVINTNSAQLFTEIGGDITIVFNENNIKEKILVVQTGFLSDDIDNRCDFDDDYY